MKPLPRIAQLTLATLLAAGAGMTAGVAEADGGRHRSACSVHARSAPACRSAAVHKCRHGHGNCGCRLACVAPHPRYGRVDFGLYRWGSAWHARPAAMRSFVVRRGRVVVVRPVPVWSCAPAPSGVAGAIRIRSGNTTLALALGKSDPEYGCPFCGRSFASYGRWKSHARGCGEDEVHGRVAFESWDEDDLAYFRARLELSGVTG